MFENEATIWRLSGSEYDEEEELNPPPDDEINIPLTKSELDQLGNLKFP